VANIVLRNGKTLVYNNVENMSAQNGIIRLGGEDRNKGYLIALIPMDVVERAEYAKPCKVYRHSKRKTVKK